MAFLIPKHKIYLNALSQRPTLVFDIYLPETARELRCIPVNLYKASNQFLKYIADELNIPSFERMPKMQLARMVSPYLQFMIPEHLKQYQTGPATFSERYEHIQQLYIPLEWQVSNGKGFRVCNPPPGEDPLWYFSNLKQNTPVKLRALCDYIGVEDSSMLNKLEMVDLLEDKLVFQERSS